MSKSDFLLTIKDMLLKQKEELKKPMEIPSIDMDGDEVDEIQGKQIALLNNQLNIRNAAKAKQIEEALHRLDQSKYGNCSDCEEEIAEKRLLFNPCLLLCVACAEDREIEQKQRGK